MAKSSVLASLKYSLHCYCSLFVHGYHNSRTKLYLINQYQSIFFFTAEKNTNLCRRINDNVRIQYHLFYQRIKNTKTRTKTEQNKTKQANKQTKTKTKTKTRKTKNKTKQNKNKNKKQKQKNTKKRKKRKKYVYYFRCMNGILI